MNDFLKQELLITINNTDIENIESIHCENNIELIEQIQLHKQLRDIEVIADDFDIARKYKTLFFDGKTVQQVNDVDYFLNAPDFVKSRHIKKVDESSYINSNVKKDIVKELNFEDIKRISEDYDIVCIKAQTGTGKSKQVATPVINEAIENHSGAFVISPLVSIVNTIKNNCAGISHYQELTSEDLTNNSIVTTINSSHQDHIKTLSKKSSVVVIEEFASCFETIALNEKLRGVRKNIYNNLLSTLINAEKAYLLDADLNDIHIEFLKQTNKKIIVIEVEQDYSDIDVEFGNKGQIIHNINEAVSNNEKVVVAVDTKSQANAIAEQLGHVEGVLVIHGNNKDLEKQKQFIDNPNELEGINVLIYNSVICRSLSIETKHFDRHFGIFTGVLAPNSCIQMLRRDRTATKFEVAIDAQQVIPYEETDFSDDCLEAIREQNLYLRETISSSLKILMQLLKFNVTDHVYNEDQKAIGYKLDAQSKKAVKEKYNIAVLTSERKISLSDAKKMRVATNLTNQKEADRDAVLINDLCGEVSEDSINFFGHSVGYKAMQFHEILSMTDAQRIEIDEKEKDYLAADKTYAQLIKSIYSTIFQHAWTGERFEITDENARSIIEGFGNKRYINHLNIHKFKKNESLKQNKAKLIVLKFIKVLGLKARSVKVGYERVSRIYNCEVVNQFVQHYIGQTAMHTNYYQMIAA